MGDKRNKVVVSCGTKFHSDYMAHQLQKHDLLEKILTAHPKSRYLNRVAIDEKLVTFLPPIFIFSYVLNKLIGTGNGISKWLDTKMPILFDSLAAKKVKNSKLLITWAWSGLNTIKQIKKNNGIAIVEQCGSCNKFQNELLEQEYKNLRLKFENPTPDFIVNRQLEEVNFADYILCPSKHVMNSFIANGVDEKKCILIPYGVNKGLFKPLFLQKMEFTIICVGTIGVRKGHYYLFKALEKLIKQLPIKCILIGKIENQFLPIFNEYSYLFKHYDYILNKDLVNYYNQASVFLLPSLDEGMALVQLEAMACGLPVICTPNSGGDSIVENGIDGFIIATKSVDEIVEKVKFLYENPDILSQFSTNATKKINHFTWDIYGNKLAEFINSLSK